MAQAVDATWKEKTYRGNPNKITNPFSDAILISTRDVFAINYSNIQNQEQIHHRWTRKYSLDAGIYQFNYITDDGMRIFIDLPDGTVVSQANPFSPNGNSWQDQGNTNYRANFDMTVNQFETNGAIVTIRVEHYNGSDEWWAIFNEPLLLSLHELPPNAPAPQPPAPAKPPVPLPPTSLVNMIQLSKVSVNKTYRKGTMTALIAENVTFTNISAFITAAVSIDSVPGVTFEPKAFTLLPQSSTTVTISFDPAQFEKLKEGVSQLVNVINIAGTSISDRPSVSIIPPVPK